MTFFVEGLIRLSQDVSDVRRVGEYDKLEDAIGAAQKVIDDFLIGKWESDMNARELFLIYQNFGEVPFIFRDGDKTLNVGTFNHFKYALIRCNAICDGAANSFAQEAYPTLVSDAEFNAIRHRMSAGEHRGHDRWDTTAIGEQPPKTDGLPECTIEQRFPHVAQTLVSLWASEACALYIQRLLISDRTTRDGFPPDVVEDLLLLHVLNNNRMGKR